MPYRTQFSEWASQQIRQWGLSDPVWMEVLLRLQEHLAEAPTRLLESIPGFPTGMFYYFRFPDPDRTEFLHEFAFQVVYRADEQHLLVQRGSYWRHAGGLPKT